MPHPRLSSAEIAQRGQAIYHDQLRAIVETPDRIGKLVSINVETGDYEIGEDLVFTGRQLQARQADAAIWTERIGFNAVYAVGGTLSRTIIEMKVENLKRKIEQEKERTSKMEQAVESLNHRGEGVVINITNNIQQCKDDIVDAQGKENKFLKIIGVAAQIATAAEVSANVIGMVISGLQSLGLFR
jgi:hypothetical protein